MTIIPEAYRPHIQALLRIMIGLLFLQHGLSKLIDFPHMDGISQMPAGLRYTAGTHRNRGRNRLDCGLSNARRGVHPVRLCRRRLFHGSRADGLFPRPEFWRARDPVLLLGAVSLGRRPGNLVVRPQPATRLTRRGPLSAPRFSARRRAACFRRRSIPGQSRRSATRHRRSHRVRAGAGSWPG